MGLVAMKCPTCGADIQLDNSREYGFCNYCGTKVMQEKVVVEHKGSVKIDNKELGLKQLKKARTARQNKDWEDVSKYYDLYNDVFDVDLESKFYIPFANMIMTLSDVDYLKKKNKAVPLINAINGLYKIYKSEDKDIITDMCNDIDYLVLGTDFAYQVTKNGNGTIVKSELKETRALLFGIQDAFVEFLLTVADKDAQINYLEFAVNYYIFVLEQLVKEKVDSFAHLYEKSLVTNISDILLSTNTNDKSVIYGLEEFYGVKYHIEEKQYIEFTEKIIEIIEKLKQLNYDDIETLESNYELIDKSFKEVNEKQKVKDEESEKNGCYVATAVYGSYDCPEVWTLRRYRDNQLAKTWYGRLFIHTYYAISPTLVKWFGDTQWFKNMWKPKLDSMVKELQESGVESTPYEDRKW